MYFFYLFLEMNVFTSWFRKVDIGAQMCPVCIHQLTGRLIIILILFVWLYMKLFDHSFRSAFS